MVAAKKVPEHIFQAHGAWKCTQSMNGYIERSLENKLLPTSVMGY